MCSNLRAKWPPAKLSLYKWVRGAASPRTPAAVRGRAGVLLMPPARAPFTLAPFTLAPFTLAPFTLAPFTLAPFTLAPFTLAPFTLAPFTLAPFTLAPFTLAPAAGVIPDGRRPMVECGCRASSLATALVAEGVPEL
jgi:hypothetical protein